jgi:hypothetical protein
VEKVVKVGSFQCGLESILYTVKLSLSFASCMYCTKSPIYVFPEIKRRGLVPYSYIDLSMIDLYIPRIVCLFGCSKIGRPILGIYKSLTDT